MTTTLPAPPAQDGPAPAALAVPDPRRWIAPALALALGTVVGVHRAAGGLIALWLLAVVAPALAQRELPLLLEPSSAAGWLAALVVAAAVLAVRRAGYRHAAPSL